MIRDALPPVARRWVYTILGAGLAVNGVLGILDDGIVAKVVAVAGALGFTLAAGNVAKADES